MSGGRPASLEGSLLARKGAATPAIRDESPLVLQLDEHRAHASVEAPEPAGGDRETGAGSGDGADSAQRGATMRLGAPSRRIWAAATGVAAAAAIAVALWPAPDAKDTLPARAEVPPVVASADASSPPKIEPVSQPSARPPEAAQPLAQQQTAVAIPAAEPVPVAATDDPAPVEPVIASVAPAPVAADKPVIPVNAPGIEVPPAAGDAEATPEIATEVPKTVAPVPVPRAKPAHAAIPVGPYAVQLASIPNERRARQEAFRLQKNLGHILGGREIRVEKAVLKSKRTTYRLRASGYRTQAEARTACAQIGRLKVDCLPIRR